MGSTEFPFMSLWFSSLFQLSLSLLLTGSKRDAPALDRSGISAMPSKQGISTRCEQDFSDCKMCTSLQITITTLTRKGFIDKENNQIDRIPASKITRLTLIAKKEFELMQIIITKTEI